MMDIFENTVLCKNCNRKMLPNEVNRKGFVLRTLACDSCRNQIVHPEDLKEYENFQNLKKKNFKVKLRFVGNSHAVSIPKEIIDFMKERERAMNEVVDLCLEDFGRLSLRF
jgi:hypothetical protein